VHDLIIEAARRVPERELRPLRAQQQLRHDLPEDQLIAMQHALPADRMLRQLYRPAAPLSQVGPSPTTSTAAAASRCSVRTFASARHSSTHRARSAGVS